jgi:polyisoprenoid-binding protein YceI
MNRKIIISTMLLTMITIAGFSQNRYFTKTGKVSFYSKSSLENIEAHNKNAVSVFDRSTGQVEVSILMKAFEFEKALMEEHFNENYVESDKFPKSVFKGKINELSAIDFSKNGKYTGTVTGQLNLHGQTKDINAPVTFTVNNGSINVTTEFKLLLEDYKIAIPSIVKDNISKEITITLQSDFVPLNR